MASRTFGELSWNIPSSWFRLGTMSSANFYLSGPSAIAPKAIREAYLSFQSCCSIFCYTNWTMGPMISFLRTRAHLTRQQPADILTPSSSQSSSSSMVLMAASNRGIKNYLTVITKLLIVCCLESLVYSTSAIVVQNSMA